VIAPFRVPRDHVWRQSSINAWLRCGRALELELSGVEPRHELDGWAALIGDAVHEGIAAVLRSMRDRRPIGDTSEERAAAIEGVMQDAFARAVGKAQDAGGVTDPEGVTAAMERVTEQAELVAQLAADARVQAIEWRGVEDPFAFEGTDGRRFSGTRDAWGIATRRIEAFAADGVELVAVEKGDLVLADWKSGQDVSVDHVSRAHNVQLPLYRTGLPSGAPVRMFLALTRDLERRKVVEGTPKRLTPINPDYAAALGIDLKAEAALEACKKRPSYPDGPNAGKPIPKRLDLINPAWLEATQRPRGPVFHEVRPDWHVVSRTIADVIDAARAGIFPASGAATGQCRRCEFRTRCAHAQPNQTTTTTHTTHTKETA
jgi:hypothetical protein